MTRRREKRRAPSRSRQSIPRPYPATTRPTHANGRPDHATPRRPAGRQGLPHRRAARSWRWSGSSRAGGNKLLGEILVDVEYCTRGPDRRVPGRRVRRPLRQARRPAVRPQGRRRPAPRVHRREPRAAAVRRPRHADDRRLRAVEPVPDRRDPQPARQACAGPDRRRHAERHPADDHVAAQLEGLRDRRHHRRLGVGRRHADRGGHRGHRRRRGDRRPVAGDPAGQLHHLQRRQGRRQRHPHRAGRTVPARSATASTAGCTSRSKCRCTCSARSPAASRSWPRMDISERRLPQDGRVHVLLGRPQDRPPREHLPHHPRRKDRHPRARHPDRLAEPRRPGLRRGHPHRRSGRASAPPTASSWSPAPPAAASRPRSTPR